MTLWGLSHLRPQDRASARRDGSRVVVVAFVAMVVSGVLWSTGLGAQRRYLEIPLRLDLVSNRLLIPGSVDGAIWVCVEAPVEPLPCVRVSELRRHVGEFDVRGK